MMQIGSDACLRAKSITLMPDSPDILKSVSTTSNFSASRALKASSALQARKTSNFSSSASSSPSRVCSSSSTINKLGFMYDQASFSVDSSNCRLADLRGNFKVTIVPDPSLLSTPTSPSWSRMIRCTIIIPIPCPCFLVVK